MTPPLLHIGLLADKELFISIHDTKKQFKDLLVELSNGLENDMLSNIYPKNKGLKVSMGNELEKCPYQVLDIFRDFDKKRGHNIRVLNWWGHGLYLFIFFGKELAAETLRAQTYFQKEGYKLAKSSSPWDYGRVLKYSPSHNDEDIEGHLLKFGFLQWYKEIKLETDADKLKQAISEQLDQIFHFHRI